MKRTIVQFMALVSAAMLSHAAADGAGTPAPRLASGQEKLRVGIFVDQGARSNGWASWLRLLHSSPQVEPVLLDGAGVRSGALAGIDVFVMPGGNSLTESDGLQAAGRTALKSWIAGGGLYFGTCAGCSFLMQGNDKFLKLIPYTRHSNTPSGGADLLWVDVTARGEELTGIRAGRHPMRYHGGPMLVPTSAAVEGTDIEVVATWSTDYRTGSVPLSMVGFPTLLCGTHGQGKLFLTTGHPEHFLRSRDFIIGGFRYLAGVELTFTPQPRPRSVQSVVGFYTPCVAGIADAQLFLDLDADPNSLVVPVQDDDITGGALDRLTKLVLPTGLKSEYASHNATIQPYLDSFTARGGILDDRRQ